MHKYLKGFEAENKRRKKLFYEAVDEIDKIAPPTEHDKELRKFFERK